MKHEVTSMYTKTALSNALKKRMETKPFSKITVSDIIADCGLNRKTFYYHFEDMRDLLRWTLRHEAINVVESFDFATDNKEAILFVVDYLEQNQHMLNCVYDAVGSGELRMFLYEDFKKIARKIITTAENQLGKRISEEYKDLLASFYTDGIVGIIIEWLNGKFKLEKSSAVRYVTDIFKGSLTGLIEHAESV
ncbi:MAG: TetR/AcrR family transcriptional regulator C-terminal domain-containing protein [Oscillospiraceae bacterium]|nr:TetR/AcrR family transcriptional regulator [[Eubacterium] saphenum]